MKLSLALVTAALVAAVPLACSSSGGDDSEAPLPDAAVAPAPPEASTPVDDAAPPPVDAGPRLCSNDGFCPVALPSGTHTLRGVWGDGAGAVWAVSVEGEVLRFDGAVWSVHATALGSLQAIWGSGATDLWIGGDRGLYHGTGTSSAALTFTSVTLAGPVKSVQGIWGSAASNVWVVTGVTDQTVFPPTASGRVYHHGATAGWSVDAISSTPVAFSHVWGNAAGGVWVAGLHAPPPDGYDLAAAVYQTPPGATKFVEVVLPPDPNADPLFNRLGVIGGAAAGADATFMAGRLADPSGTGIPAVWSGERSADGGTTPFGGTFKWTYTRDGFASTPSIHALWANGPSDVWAAGDAGRVRHFDGHSWLPVAITHTKFPVTQALYGVWSSGAMNVWIVGEDIVLRRGPT